ncbi:MAG: hypothetical protein HW381_301 [Candidatus Rokubacteria bacterium]|nr:hypothetical protein [Candidatus Rokubacteria bacterium]
MGSPVAAKARAREPPQGSAYSQRPQRPVKSSGRRSVRKSSESR